MLTISIHAPRTGSDENRSRRCMGGGYFNPRSPHGERREYPAFIFGGCIFQSTLPARGATSDCLHLRAFLFLISIHAPRTGSDEISVCMCIPTSISIHAPRTGSDPANIPRRCTRDYFNPRSPHGERQNLISQIYIRQNFNPRSPHGERPVCAERNA